MVPGMKKASGAVKENDFENGDEGVESEIESARTSDSEGVVVSSMGTRASSAMPV